MPFHPIHSGCLSSQKTHIARSLRVSFLLQTQDARSAHDGAAHDGTASQHIHQGVVVVADEIVAMKFLSAKTDEQFSQGVLHRNSVCGVDRGIAAVIFLLMENCGSRPTGTSPGCREHLVGLVP